MKVFLNGIEVELNPRETLPEFIDKDLLEENIIFINQFLE